MPSKKPSARRPLSFVLSAALVCSLVGTPSRAMGAGDGGGGSALTTTQRTDAQVDELVSSMLAAGDYVEGEAIVCCLGEGADGLAAQSDGPLAQAERLSAVTARQYAEATGETLPAAQEQGLLTAQAQDEEVRILKVCDYSQSTEQLLRALLDDPQVLSAEPNYLMDLEDYYADEDWGVSDQAASDAQGPESKDDQGLGEADVSDAVDTQDAAGVSSTDEAVSADQDAAEVADQSFTDADDQAPADAAPADASTFASQQAPLTVQSSGIVAAGGQTNLTGYQWFSAGTDAAISQYANGPNPGVQAPGWNDPSVTNSSGVVAIMDSGVDYNHPDLEGALYRFSPELRAQLGCGEFGYAPSREDPTDPMDGYGHGTHCAGIVAARWNDFGVSGIANGAQVLMIAISKSVTNSGFTYDGVIKGYDFMIRAVKAGVDIRSVNRSLAQDPINNANAAMIKAAGEMGIITCYATGNFDHNHDTQHDETNANQQSPYVLRVNASGPHDGCAQFSDYGQYITDLFSPGVSILSTIPTASSRLGPARYFVEADEDPLYSRTNFSDSLLDATTYENLKLNSVSEGNIGYDGDGSSIKMNISTRVDSGAANAIFDIPVGNLTMNDIQDINFAFYAAGYRLYQPRLHVLLEDGTFSNYEAWIEDTTDKSSDGWNIISVRLHPDQADKGLGYVTDSKGNRCIRVYVTGNVRSRTVASDAPVDIDLYIDQVAIGRPNNTGVIPYSYMDGTSMAAPVVSACAAIASSQIEEGDLAERAAKTVRMLKGAVRQAEGYQGLCKQNGEIDLRLLGSDDGCVPVLESARVSGDELVLDGAYFSGAGTLTVGGQQARVISWSEGTIVAEWPQGVTSGLIPISVKTDAGAESCRAFALSAPDSVGGADVYERDLGTLSLNPGSESINDNLQSMAMTENGSLFVAVRNADGGRIATVHHLLRSNDQGTTYKSIELPQELTVVNLAVSGNQLYILGSEAENNTFIKAWHIYRLDAGAETESFEHLCAYDAGEGLIADESALVCLQGRLYIVDSRHVTADDGKSTKHMRIRCFDDDFAGFHGEYLLDHAYKSTIFTRGPMVGVVDNSIYVCGIGSLMGDAPVVSDFVGLERVDVTADGTMSCTDLSAALAGVDTRVTQDDHCMAASDDGIFIIGKGLDGLLPEGAAYTDTFFLKHGGSTFEPYEKTLSYASIERPIATYADGWLYAYGVSNYEEWPMFGRATKVGEDPQPGPEPTPTPTPTPAPQPAPVVPDKTQPSSTSTAKSTSTSKRLAKTGEVTPYAAMAGVTVAGALALALGLQKRRRTQR